MGFQEIDGTLGIEALRFMARLIIDFNEVFSFVKYISILVLLAMDAQFDLELEQHDVKTSFMHGEFMEQIYMYQPKYFFHSRKRRPCFLIEEIVI